MKYHKINSIYHRYTTGKEKGRFNRTFYADKWIEALHLSGYPFEWTEKIDGTNIRLDVDPTAESKFRLRGRTGRAEIPTGIIDYVRASELDLKLLDKYSSGKERVVLFGEGCGRKIQKGGHLYSDIQRIILFDVATIDDVGRVWWLPREAVDGIAHDLDIASASIVGYGPLWEAEELVTDGLVSLYGDEYAEGLVCRPEPEVYTKKGSRIIVKIKHKDYYIGGDDD